MSTANDSKQSVRTRSPAYPAIPLKKAVERARELNSHERRNLVHIDVVLQHWGYDARSSNGNRTLAALKQFGLLVEQGKKDSRQVKLSPMALEILMPEQEGGDAYLRDLQRAALMPVLHKDVWEKYGGELPSDAALKRYLILEKNFNDTFVDRFIRQFRATIAYAKLTADDTIHDEGDDLDLDNGEGREMDAEKRSAGEGKAGFSPPDKPPAAPKGMRDFPLYTSDQRGLLYVPGRMSSKDYELLKMQVENSLAIIKATAVSDESG